MNDERRLFGEALTLTVGPDGVAVITLDVPGEQQNTLKASFSNDFEALLDALTADTAVKAVVLISGKPDSFLAGADVQMLAGVKSSEEASLLSRRGQYGFNRLESLHIPIVAAIHGPCLGGGLELALACRARVCSSERKTTLGLPEVQLGLLPGAGGTQRLPRLIGVAAALDLMLTGKQVRPEKALKLGLVNEVVPRSLLLKTASALALQLVEAPREPVTRAPLQWLGKRLKGLTDMKAMQERVLEDTPIGRRVLFQQARKKTLSKTWGNYPAAEKILDVVEQGLERGIDAGLEAEARAFGELVMTPQARELMGIFFATQALKKDSGVSKARIKPRPIQQVGVLGAGLMGAGVAYVTAQADIPVRLKDREDAGVLSGLRAVKERLDAKVKRRALSRNDAEVKFSRVTGTTTLQGFDACDVVVEAVFEQLELKQQLLREIEQCSARETIFASNTSSIPITRLAEAAAHPERVIGMHYFSPVDKMPLLEIIVTDKTADWVTATCVELGKKQGKTVIVVRDGVGFYTSRILAPYMNEAARLLSEGVSIDQIDTALKRWGFPVGPITLLDEVGIDVAEKVGRIMIDAFGSRLEPPEVMHKLVADGRAGRKNKKGFYTYDGPKKEVDKTVYQVLGINPLTQVHPSEITERCALLMVNEALRCYGEGILRSPRDGDIGAVFGLGFPPFRGGPFRYVDQEGAGQVLKKLEDFSSRYGLRFAPAPILFERASSGKKFYP